MSANATPEEPYGTTGQLVVIGVAGIVIGVGAGLVAAAFRWVLEHGGSLRTAVIEWAHGYSFLGFLLIVAVAALMCAVAAALVRIVEPHAEGSGIPHVEAIVEGRKEPASLWLVPVKFVGGVLAIGAGLPLGREGPLVQMGAGVSHLVTTLIRRSAIDSRILMAAAAGAGLAAAFNAPLAGGIFVLEELVKRFDTRIMIAVLATSSSSITIIHLLLGSDPVFEVPPIPDFSLAFIPIVLILGLISGILGVMYNKAILRGQAVADRLTIPVELRAASIGALVAAIAWFAPSLVGGGDPLTERILLGGQFTVIALVGLFALRFVLGVLAYSAGTPGGLFAPMLVLGSALGAAVGGAATVLIPGSAPGPTTMALVGMAAFFAASVRAPVTGMILVIEMTGATPTLTPMLIACCISMLFATLVRNKPIYDALADRSAEKSN
ncbi:ClC family H(+)/Cl(-) exchange transporter [Devriesea agamarum]|uniref:ClC family H(+)/Cl(-) exchange transporter n=1 Tax=Devriesea agamarum TaxID=472569 RepID=UPI00071CF24E|nr:ClC family H(+)/Cl(-) exchange transporter [Devriesea agamarum]